MKNSLLYSVSKWLFLLINAALLPIATYFILSNISVYDWGLIILIGVYTLIPFWLVYFLGMGMYRFPLGTTGAVALSGSLILEIAIYYFIGEGIIFSSYVAFLSSFYGISLFLLAGLLATFFKPISKAKHFAHVPLTTALLGFTALFSFGLTKPLATAIKQMSTTAQSGAVVSFIIAVLIIAFSSYQMTREQKSSLRDKQWKSWTNATAGALLFSLLSTIGVIFTI